jgi:hypothetical protein
MTIKLNSWLSSLVVVQTCNLQKELPAETVRLLLGM